jgi:molecular chaperone GrpE (heat shock protein)
MKRNSNLKANHKKLGQSKIRKLQKQISCLLLKKKERIKRKDILKHDLKDFSDYRGRYEANNKEQQDFDIAETINIVALFP